MRASLIRLPHIGQGPDFFRFIHGVTISRNCEIGIDFTQIQLSNQVVISMS